MNVFRDHGFPSPRVLRFSASAALLLLAARAAQATTCTADAECGRGFQCSTYVTSVGSGTGGGPNAVCGDLHCYPGETPTNCPSDCVLKGNCEPGGCQWNGDCAVGWECPNGDAGKVPPSVTPDGGACANGSCPWCSVVDQPCALDADCAPGLVCDRSSRQSAQCVWHDYRSGYGAGGDSSFGGVFGGSGGVSGGGTSGSQGGASNGVAGHVPTGGTAGLGGTSTPGGAATAGAAGPPRSSSAPSSGCTMAWRGTESPFAALALGALMLTCRTRRERRPR